jgi:alkylation response protein AidB-like acyl-CoA dehydrogenase
MPLTDIEVGVTDEERVIGDTAHKFAEEVLRPAGTELDRLSGPAEVIAPGSRLWDVFEKYRELGFGAAEAGGADTSPVVAARIRSVINEELGWGDSGLAVGLVASGLPAVFARLSGREELIQRYCAPGNREIGCWAITEPDHGSDTLAFNQSFFSDPSPRPNCVARRDGDEYVIRGQKAAWVSNGTIASVAALFCTIEPERGFRGGGVALVPLDLSGVARGQPLDSLGQRALNQGEIFFDEVRIPAEYMVIGADAYAGVVEMVLTMANVVIGTIFLGVARAALEHALAYARERVQGGVPIFEHQSVKAKLFQMFSRVEAARSLARRVNLYNSTGPQPLLHYAIATKTFCTDTAFEISSEALQIFGGNGLSREYPLEKLLRDARGSLIADGANDILSLVGAEKL